MSNKVNLSKEQFSFTQAKIRVKNYLREQAKKIVNPKARKDIDFDNMKFNISEKCPFCNNETFYNQNYDAYYCKECNVWLEPTCSDEECEFCKNRPERPV